MSGIKVHYFNIAGRAEPTRIALHAAGVEFENVFVDHPTWATLKSSVKPFHQLPYMEVDGKQLAQSNNMLLYVSEKYNVFRPEGDAFVQAKAREAMFAMEDFFVPLIPTFHMEDKEEAVKIRQQLLAEGGKLHQILIGISEWAEATVDEPVNVGDITVFNTLATFTSGMFDGITVESIYGAFPALKAHRNKVANHPKVAAYYNAENAPHWAGSFKALA